MAVVMTGDSSLVLSFVNHVGITSSEYCLHGDAPGNLIYSLNKTKPNMPRCALVFLSGVWKLSCLLSLISLFLLVASFEMK